MSKNTKIELRLLTVVAAIFLAHGNTYAEEESEVQDMITPGSSASIGVGVVNTGKDAKRFSQYTGLNQSTSALLDIEFNKRDVVTGSWIMIDGRNLGLDTRELSISQSKQGNWKYTLDYNETVRRDPYIIHTGMTGVGTATPTIKLIAQPDMPAAWAAANFLVAPVSPAPASDVELKLKRTAIGLSGEKWFSPELQFELSFRTENKKGARLFGRAGLTSGDMLYNTANVGTTPNFAILLTPEPIDSNIQQIEGKLNFNREKLALTGGYYGSFYINNVGSMSPIVPGTLNRGALLATTTCGASLTVACSVQELASSSVALPPDNQAHQLYFTGNYALSQTTRSNFKISYTHATQNESFVAMGLTPPLTPSSLGGVVDTTLAQFGLTMRPLKELSVSASLRYEDRADKTPVYVYNYGKTGGALDSTTNWPSGSQTRTTAKLDGIYRLQSGYSVMLGGDLERKATPLPPSNTALFNKQVFFRPVLNEYGIHADLRKALSETLNGALGLEYKQRRGKDSDWVTASGASGNPMVAFDPSLLASGTSAALSGGNVVLPDMYMDRNRTKVRGNLDWNASEKLSLQAVVEHAQDDYKRAFPTSITPAQFVPIDPGAHTIISESMSLDTTYLVSEDWRVNAFWTYSFNRWNVNKANLGDDTRNTVDTFGIKVNGNATSRLTVGMDILATRDTTTFNNVVATSNVPSPGNIAGWVGQTLPGNYLPNINYTTDKLNLHAKYALNKMSDVQATFLFQHFKTDDWQWGYNGVPFLYSDNTTVSQPMNQNLKFIGAGYMLRF
jgi:MtrB/PioB family decaheme-associated outer membrane protein